MKMKIILLTVISLLVFSFGCKKQDEPKITEYSTQTPRAGEIEIPDSSMNTWISGSFAVGEVKWYYINATAGISYTIQWDDSYSGSGTYTGDIKVSAYKEDKTTSYFLSADTGYSSTVQKVITPSTTEKIFLKVEGYYTTKTGTYGLKITRGCAVSYPLNLSASTGLYLNKVTLTWGAVTNASGYNIYRAVDSSAGTYTKLNTNGVITANSYDDLTVSSVSTYYYKVTALDNLGSESAQSSYIMGYPQRSSATVPSTPTASDGLYSDKIVISWSASSNATKYNIYRSTSYSGTYTKINSTPLSATSYDDNSVQTGTYYYKLSAVDSNLLETTLSYPDSGYLSVPAPTSLTATQGTRYSYVFLQWEGTPGTTGYQVYYNTINDPATATFLVSSTKNFYTHTSPVKETTYYYWVTAKDASSHYSVKSTGASGYASTLTGDSFESDNTLAEAKILNPIIPLQFHSIHNSTDEDWVKFRAESGKTYVIGTDSINATGVSGVTDVNTEMFLYQADNTLISSNNDSSLNTAGFSIIEFTCQTSGWYYVKIKGYNGSLGDYVFGVIPQ